MSTNELGRLSRRGVVVCAGVMGVVAPCVLGQTKEAPADEDVPGAIVLPTGVRRTYVDQTVHLTSEQILEAMAQGKNLPVDPATGDMVVEHIVDHLPVGWNAHAGEGGRVDSMGNPIVNEVQGLPGWAPHDIDALRNSLAQTVTHMHNLAAAIRGDALQIAPTEQYGVKVYHQPVDGLRLTVQETEGILGNFIGQAIVRGIPFADIVSLDDKATVTPGAADAILDYLHFYENIKFSRAESWGYTFAPSAYADEINRFAAAHGRKMTDVLAIDNQGGVGVRTTPSSCYSNSTFTRGMTNLSGATVIWAASGNDDSSADVPIGWSRFYFYSCDDPDQNSQVRVSTNGYISFFQQGGGALDGANFSNDPITSTLDPDGYAAPWWDDLIVATSQGNTDTVQYKTEGATGERVFTVEWFSMSRLGGDSDDYHFFQVKLFEANDNVELHISNDFNGDSVDNATIGMEDFDGLDGDCGPNCGNANTTATATNNYRFSASRPAGNLCVVIFGIPLYIIDPNGDVLVESNLGADGTDVSSCGFNDIHDIWFAFTAPASGDVVITTDHPATNIDTTLALFDECGGTQIQCDDDGGSGLTSRIVQTVVAGEDYFIRAAGYNGAEGTIALSVRYSNDACADAIPILSEGTITGNVTYASNTGTATCGSSSSNRDLWYSFTAPDDGRLTVSTCGTHDAPGTDMGMDTVLALFDGCGGPELACDDDNGPPACPAGQDTSILRDSVVQTSMSAGQTVFVRVSYFGSTGTGIHDGAFRLNTEFTVSNDSCATAENIPSLPFVDMFNNTFADSDVPPGSCNSGSAADLDNGIWYRWQAPATRTFVRATVDAPGWDTLDSIWFGTCGALISEVACADEPEPAVARFTAIGGNIYFFHVGDWGVAPSGGDGTFTLERSCPCEQDGDTAQVNVFDLLAYLSVWFPTSGSGTTPGRYPDLNADGVINVFDLLDFLSCWFPASAGSPCP